MASLLQSLGGDTSPPSRAAWIEMPKASAKAEATVSPPSRAAWIEIKNRYRGRCSIARRRLHGRRGLKSKRTKRSVGLEKSPPSRAAWIEIDMFEREQALERVAAFTGGVD